MSLLVDGHEVQVTRGPDGAAQVWVDGVRCECVLRPGGRYYELSADDQTERIWLAVEGDIVYVHAFGHARRLEVVDPIEREQREAAQGDTVMAPTPGMVVSVTVADGDEVEEKQVLMVIESMKMHSEIVALRDGVVERVHVRQGENFDRDAALVSLVESDEEVVA